ncbi:MAG TPA: tRNA (N(6)-L-threonylcarbamoyladenosine(37)-C(2))-methylthiotransferase MtaB [Armatimonadota bacterium]|nr:tRNA (N(6)-L-threonylcarbamoyladenosine(37)-C(2))-methylthiotransferase MtaB [Armatimonadota bacterium]
MTSARVRVFTFGCKVNQCDSEEIARSLADRGYAIGGRGDPADIYIVNTCTVTATADAKARKLIRRLARGHPEATIIATGCLAETDPYALLDLPGVAAVVPNSRKLALADFLPGLQAPLGATSYLPSRTRSFVKLQDGCDRRCAYCVVPSARGKPVSKPGAAILSQAQCLADAGSREVVLCGVRLGAYGADRGDATLAALLRKLREIDIPRLRLSSIEPMDLTDDLLAEMADHPTLCHHLHLPLQSGDDDVLAAMGRGYTAADFASLVGRVREVWSDAAITTDIMVGFPGETDGQFEHSLTFVRETAFTRLHVFPYSSRPDTAAAERADQVPPKTKRARTDVMLALADDLARATALAWIGRTVSVLIEEREKGDLLAGHTPHYLKVHTPGPDDWIGRIIDLTPTREEHGELFI